MPVIEAQAVSKRFLLRHNASVELKVRFLGLLHPGKRQSIEEFWALKQVSLDIERGDAIGLVGRNGSGKSTLLKLDRRHSPADGRAAAGGRRRPHLFDDRARGRFPSRTDRTRERDPERVDSWPVARRDRSDLPGRRGVLGLEHFIDVPIKNYSSGMYMRLGFAIAANLDPDVLLLDEIFAVGDADFQQRCIATVNSFIAQGKTIIFVSHAPSAIRSICRRVCVLEHGELVFDGDVDGGLQFYEELLAGRPHV